MPKANTAVKFDVDGSEIMSKVLMELLNTCPALCGRRIAFSTLGEDDGLAFFPSVGAAITSEKESPSSRRAWIEIVTCTKHFSFWLAVFATPSTCATKASYWLGVISVSPSVAKVS